MSRREDGYTGILSSNECLIAHLGIVKSNFEIPDFDVFCRVQTELGKCAYWAECRRSQDRPLIIDHLDTHGECITGNHEPRQQG